MSYLLLLMGALIYLAFKFKPALRKEDFKISIFIRNNIADVIINMLVGISMIWAGVNIPFEYAGVNFDVFLWVIVGFAGQALFRKIIRVFEKKTYVKQKPSGDDS